MFARPVLRQTTGLCQHARLMSTGPKLQAKESRMRLTPWITGAAVVAASVWVLRPSHEGHVERYEKKKDSIKDAPKVFTGGDQGFVKLKLAKSEEVSHNARHLVFEFDDPNAVSGLSVASALLTKFQPADKEKPVLRPYTPISSEDEPGKLEFVVKKYPNGPMSNHLHDLKVGQSLEFKGPLPKYPWSPNKHETVAMIAGGTGITPCYQVIRRIFENPSEKTNVTLIFGNVTEEDILLKKELARLENDFPSRFRAFYVLDNPPDSWRQHKGFITKDLLKQLLPEPSNGDKIKIFVCGPPLMYKAISGGKKSPSDQGELTGYLQELGYSKDQVYKF